MVGAKPVASKICSKKWEERAYELHRKKLANIKPSIDTKAPKQYSHFKSNKKKQQMQEERYYEIQRENNILLGKMSHIMQSKGGVDMTPPARGPSESLNRSYRVQKLEEITTENLRLLTRLQSKKPTISRVAMERDFLVSEARVAEISEFPASPTRGKGRTQRPPVHDEEMVPLDEEEVMVGEEQGEEEAQPVPEEEPMPEEEPVPEANDGHDSDSSSDSSSDGGSDAGSDAASDAGAAPAPDAGSHSGSDSD